ncbi:MAG: pectinesterase family protein [Candidatus Marinimicrobia bacterium]|nr:pectinesterase family protein [Candidatus Neomarinimicrobiota bacterium]
MKKLSSGITLILIGLAVCRIALGQSPDSIIVDQKGNGQYCTITDAIAALPDFAYQRVVIFIRNGVYEEKIRLTQNYVTLRGENRDSTIIRYYQKRTDWEANKDYIGPGVVNIHANDIILENLTVENTQPEIEPHAFAIYGKGTRTIFRNCNLLGHGGDTVSLWDYQQGMYYHTDCLFRGAVDMVCPRGWSFIRNSQFFEVKTSAAIWHDGHNDSDQKFVIINSTFDGVPGFQLGRHHYDAQFFLINCNFSENMADQPIYLKTYEDPSRNNPYLWGDRRYFYNCAKPGQSFDWYKNNFIDVNKNLRPEEITPAWTFAGRWDPESQKPITITAYHIKDQTIELTFSESVTVCGQPVFVNKNGRKFIIMIQRFTDNQRLTFIFDRQIAETDLLGEMNIVDGGIIASMAYVNERHLEKRFFLPENSTK